MTMRFVEAVELQKDEPATTSDIAKTLRACLAGLKSTTTRQLLDRAEAILAAYPEATEREHLREILDQLERLGDVSIGPGGRVAAAPLRAVQCEEGEYLLVGTYPLDWFIELCGLDGSSIELVSDVPRRLKIDGNGSFKSAITKVEGRILSAESWSRIDRAPVANQRWLEELRKRLEHEGRYEHEVTVSFEGNLAWQYQSTADQPNQAWRWQELDEDVESVQGLVRYLAYGRFYRYLWIEPDEASSFGVLDLNQADAARTQFALDRVNDAQLKVLIRRDEATVVLELPGFLPPPEFKYLNALSKRVNVGEIPPLFELGESSFTSVRERLTSQLGVEFVEE
jgi:hypothetical protein